MFVTRASTSAGKRSGGTHERAHTCGEGRKVNLAVLRRTAYAVAENLVRAQAKAEAVGRLREYLNSVRERCSDCEALLVVDGHGRFVASSGGRMTGVQFSPDRLSSLRTSDALVGDPYWDTGLGKAAIGLAVPIRQPDGRYVGALMAKLNLRAVADLL